MIGFVKGTLAEKGRVSYHPSRWNQEYEISVPANSAAYLSSEGDEVKVYTMMRRAGGRRQSVRLFEARRAGCF